ncbi:PREDICTED: persephin [Gekko japonicus]|uniref:Persephin n=1 Tax=Gekko japonicus TaxID=146911 RepID=A0ABM1KS53_GEKJA|nr:PREDICTED: persephin [Gekko japonicus]
MGTPRLLYALALVLSLRLVSSRPAEDGMMRKPGIQIADALQTPLETQPPEEASWTREGLHGPPDPRRHTWDLVAEQGCHLRSLLIRVKDLGLGYDSEETILFKYCGGTCRKARTNHDMTLALLLRDSEIPAVGEPCCRPSRYEDVAFLDDSHQWHEVEQLSASSCSCMG